MSKFKVGDRVLFVDGWGNSSGEPGTVVDVSPAGLYSIDWDDGNSVDVGYEEDELTEF